MSFANRKITTSAPVDVEAKQSRDMLLTEVDGLNQTKAALDVVVAGKDQAIEAQAKANKELTNIQDAIKKAQAELETAMSAVQAKTVAAQLADEQCRKANERVTELTKLTREKTEQIAGFVIQITDYKKIIQEHANLAKNASEQSGVEIADHQRKVSEAVQLETTAKERVMVAERELETINATKLTAQTEKNRLETEASGLQSTVNDLTKSVAELEIKLGDLQTTWDGLANKIAKFKAENEQPLLDRIHAVEVREGNANEKEDRLNAKEKELIDLKNRLEVFYNRKFPKIII